MVASDSSHMGLVSGSRITHYVLDHLIAVSGMSTVWAATDTRDGRRAALKFLRADHSLDTARVRLLREAHASRRIAHPAVVPVLDVLSHEDNPVLAMDLLEGETLRAVLLREQSLPLERAARVLLPIAEALHEAHQAGIVHRDLKPDNIFLERRSDGETVTRLLDFGVARAYTPQEGIDQTPITALGSLVGTIAYMAPEQALYPSDSDPRVDVWAFGVTLYEVLSGCRPIEGNTPQETMRQLLVGGITPLAVLLPDLPHDMASLISNMLTRRPEQRLSGLSSVCDALRA